MDIFTRFPKPWEFHPMLVHFPIAFLLGGAVVLLWTSRRPSEMLHQTAASLLLAGVLFGWLAAAAGGLAYFTVPAHTEEGHGLMLWHLGLGLTMLTLFTWVSVGRWRGRTTATSRPQLIATLIGSVLLIVTGHIGGSVVFHHGAGVDPTILSREIREGHSHANGHDSGNKSSGRHPKTEPSGHHHN